MRLNRGKEWFKQFGRVAIQISRSSDGEWQKDGKLLGFFYVIPPYRGAAPHTDKMGCGLVVGEYSLLVGWYQERKA